MEYFDPSREIDVVRRRLPHWSQSGVLTFITWRTWDSLPEKVIRHWQAERDVWLANHGIDGKCADWQVRLERLSQAQLDEFKNILAGRWNDHLDACHGACVLRRPELSAIVADSLRHFDGERYVLTDFVVMPNHVHIIAAFPPVTRRCWSNAIRGSISRPPRSIGFWV
ncbi:MAG TPA: hypothetical protein VH120_21940 [Gemmataceae bacterium]|nr:hypothetical protein [Gemmataceae bacterium]